MDFALQAAGAIAVMVVLLVGQRLLLFESGVLSLGAPAFFACGAYASAILARDAGWATWASVAAAGAIGTALALAVGLALRALTADFFAVATLAVSQATMVGLRATAPGGLAGMGGVPTFGSPLARVVPEATEAVILCGGLAALSMIAANVLRRRRIGAVIRAVKLDENVAAAMGFRPAFVKLQVFVFSSLLAALAGALQAHLFGVVEPRMASIQMTVLLLVGTILSGRRSIWGCVLGAAVVVLLPDMLQGLLVSRAEPHWREFLAGHATYGVIIIALVFFLPWLPRAGQAED